MFWRVAGLATASPVDGILDKDLYTLEELLDEDDLIQECKSLNNRLITFLKAKEQVLPMVRYVVEPPPEGSDDKRNYKFPFISCEVFTCEIDQILNTVVEEPEILDLLFSFPEPDRPHSNLLAGYFSKVVNSLLLRKTPEIMAYFQAHQGILPQLVDLIGTTSIMEVVMRLVGAHDEILMYHSEKLEWLAETPLLDLLVQQLGPQKSSDIQVNAAEVLSAIARTSPAALALKLATPSYIHKLFHHVLEEPKSMTSVINSLSVCITLLGPRRLGAPGVGGLPGFRPGQPAQQPPPGQEATQLDAAMVQTIAGMLERLGALLELLDTSKDERMLVTTYGQLAPPLGIHRLKIVEFLGVLLASQSVQVFQELIRLGGVKICLDLFFRYHFNNFLHHNVERMTTIILESGNQEIVDHLLEGCDLLNRILAAYEEPNAPDTRPEPRVEEIRGPTRSGYMGHLTRIANRIAQLCTSSPVVDSVVAKNARWVEWQRTGLKTRNALENVYKWSCGRPASLDDRPQDSDDDEFNRPDRDFDIATLSLTSSAPRSYQQPRYGQPMLDTDEEEARGSSTGSFDTHMGNAEQGMTELRIDDASITGVAVSQEETESPPSASGSLETLVDEMKPAPPVPESMDVSESLFTSSDAGRTAWIAFQDELQIPEAADADSERGLVDISSHPDDPLSTSYSLSPRPPVAPPVHFEQAQTTVQHPIIEATEAAAAAAVGAGNPEFPAASDAGGSSAGGQESAVEPVVDLFADAPLEFRVHPELLAQGAVEPTPASGPSSGPVAMEMDAAQSKDHVESVVLGEGGGETKTTAETEEIISVAPSESSVSASDDQTGRAEPESQDSNQKHDKPPETG